MKKAIQLTLRDKGCLHSVLWQEVKNVAELQAAHNREMETKFSIGHNYERALMQQQYEHGIQFVLNVMAQFENMHKDGVSLFLYPWDGKTTKCRVPKIERALKAFRKVMEAR